MTDVLKPTFHVIVGEVDDAGVPKVGAEDFEFRVPTPLERAQIGVRCSALCRRFDPVAGDIERVDYETWCLVRGIVVMEVLLEKANVTWPFSEVKDSKGEASLLVDITRFPPGKENTIAEVGARFNEALDRFHGERAGHTPPAVPKTVDGVGNSGAL